MTHYQILGVQSTASYHAIKRAYRERALRYHPDRNPDDLKRSTEMFRRVREAYEVLSDAKQRKAYDLGQRSYKSQATEKEPAASQPRKSYDPQAEKIIRDFINVEERTPYESKDGLMAVLFVFLGHLSLMQWLDMGIGSMLKLLALFIVGAGGAVFVRAGARLAWTRFHRYAPDNFVRLFFYNAAAVFWIDFCCRYFSGESVTRFVLLPIVPTLLVSLPIGLFAASVGRAIASGLGNLAGFVTGGAVSALISATVGMWLIVVFLVNADGGQEQSKQAFLSLLVGVSLSSALGSASIRWLFIYDMLDWAESLADIFRPGNRSTHVAVVEK